MPRLLLPEELQHKTKLELGLPTAFALPKERSENDGDGGVGGGEICSFVELALLPSPQAPAASELLLAEVDEEIMNNINDDEGPQIEALLLEEVVLGEEAQKKRKKEKKPHDGDGDCTIPSLLLLLPAVPTPSAKACDHETSFASLARSALLQTAMLPSRPKPTLVELAAVDYDEGDSEALSSSSSSSSVVVALIEAPALPPLGAAASRARLRSRALGGVVEPVLSSLLAPAMPLEEGDAKYSSSLLIPPGAPTLAALAAEELRGGPRATTLLLPPPPPPATAAAAASSSSSSKTTLQSLKTRLGFSAVLSSLRPARAALARLELRLRWDITPPGAAKRLSRPQRVVVASAAAASDVATPAAPARPKAASERDGSGMHLLEELANTPPPAARRAASLPSSPPLPLPQQQQQQGGWKGATGIFAAADGTENQREQRLVPHANRRTSSPRANRPTPMAKDVEFFARTTAAAAAAAAGAAQGVFALAAASPVQLPRPRPPPETVSVPLTEAVARALRALAEDEVSCLNAASSASAGSAGGAGASSISALLAETEKTDLSLFDHASATAAAASASRDPAARRAGVSHALAAAAMARRLSCDAARYGCPAASVRLEGALRAVPALRRMLPRGIDAITIAAAAAEAGEIAGSISLLLHPLSAALRDALRVEAALSASSRVLVLSEAAGFLPLIHAAAAARVPATQIGGKGGGEIGSGSKSSSPLGVTAAVAAAARDGACVLVDREALFSATAPEGKGEGEGKYSNSCSSSSPWPLLFARGRFTCVIDFAPFAGDGAAAAAASEAALAAAPAWTRRVVLRMREEDLVAATKRSEEEEGEVELEAEEQQPRQQQAALPPPPLLLRFQQQQQPLAPLLQPHYRNNQLKEDELLTTGPWDTDAALAADEEEEEVGFAGRGRWAAAPVANVQQQQHWRQEAPAPPAAAPWQRYAGALYPVDEQRQQSPPIQLQFEGRGGGFDDSLELSPPLPSGGGSGGGGGEGEDPLLSPLLRLSAPPEQARE